MLNSAKSCLQHSKLAAKQRLHPWQTAASFATVRNASSSRPSDDEATEVASNDFILSILKANPSLRDTRAYLAYFGLRERSPDKTQQLHDPALPHPGLPAVPSKDIHPTTATATTQEQLSPSPVVASILNPIIRRTALVKLQGPFRDHQLESIARGLVYLKKLGLVSVIVVELDNWVRGAPGEKKDVKEEVMRIVSALEQQGTGARPLVQSIVRLGPKPGDPERLESANGEVPVPEAHTFAHDLVPIRSALSADEIPVLAPLALDSFCRSVRIHSNDVIGALARGMVDVGDKPGVSSRDAANNATEVDLTPLRLMIINREGGVPSYARSGLPHLLVNLTAEYSFIHDTFHSSWDSSHPTALDNLALARTCLSYMPPSSSAIMVSHRSPRSLIGNLITNKPELSSSLPHALLQNNGKLTKDTPTILRRGLPVRVISKSKDLDRAKLTTLLEQSFRRTLDQEAFYKRLETHLDFAIVAGDYAGAAIVTREYAPGNPEPIVYLDKFAVLPKHQGDGTVDFLWVALHDESYGLGLSFSVNPNGGKEGSGEGRDLVWRSRADNPINKWYFERSSGHLRQGKWVLFWCDAEKRLKNEESHRGSKGLNYVESWEMGRLEQWSKAIVDIPSSWT